MRHFGVVVVLVAACGGGEPTGTCEQAMKRYQEFDSGKPDAEAKPERVETCKREQRSPRELGCMKDAPDIKAFWACEWKDPAVKADLRGAYEGALPAALAKMVEANQLRREANAALDPEPLRRSLPIIDEAAAALRGFEAKSRRVKTALETLAGAIEQYRGGIAKAAEALSGGGEAALEEANAQIEDAMAKVVYAESQFNEGMVATGLKSK